MKKLKLLLPLLCVGLLVTGCGKTIPKLENGQEVVAKVDGKDFTAEDLYAAMKEKSGTDFLIRIIDKFIVESEIEDNEEALKFADGQIATLKAQYESYGQDFNKVLKDAGYQSIDVLKQDIAFDYNKNKVAENYVKSTISNKDIEKYYKDNIEGKMTVRYILVKPEVTDSMTSEEKTKAEDAALKEAKEIIQKLKDGEKFEDLAKKHSDDKTTAGEGGLYSSVEKNDVVKEFWDASVALKDNEYTTKPVKSSFGYFVILRIKQDKKPELKDVKDDIAGTLATAKMNEDEKASVKALIEVRKEYKMDIIDSDILNDYNSTVKTFK